MSHKGQSKMLFFSALGKHKAKFIFVCVCVYIFMYIYVCTTTETKGLSYKSLFTNNEIHLILSNDFNPSSEHVYVFS